MCTPVLPVVAADADRPDVMALAVRQGAGLGLPDRDYYLEDGARIDRPRERLPRVRDQAVHARHRARRRRRPVRGARTRDEAGRRAVVAPQRATANCDVQSQDAGQPSTHVPRVPLADSFAAPARLQRRTSSSSRSPDMTSLARLITPESPVSRGSHI